MSISNLPLNKAVIVFLVLIALIILGITLIVQFNNKQFLYYYTFIVIFMTSPSQSAKFVDLVQVTRGNLVENIHQGIDIKEVTTN